VVSFTSLLFYLWGKGPRYPLYRRLDGPQSPPGRYGDVKNLLPLQGIEPLLLGRPARSLAVIPTELSRLFGNQYSRKSVHKLLNKEIRIILIYGHIFEKFGINIMPLEAAEHGLS
jgi:hypothetical protein